MRTRARDDTEWHAARTQVAFPLLQKANAAGAAGGPAGMPPGGDGAGGEAPEGDGPTVEEVD